MSVIIDGTNGISDVDGSASTPAIRGTDANTGIFFPAADTIAFSEGGTESMRLDSTGDVNLYNAKSFKTYNPANTRFGSFYTDNDGTRISSWNGSGEPLLLNSPTGYFTVSTNGSERMRINSSGAVLINRTTQVNSERFAITGNTSSQCMSLTSPTTSGYDMCNMINGNGQVGVISTSGTSTSYTTSSDYRLKENIVPMTGALAQVALLKPCTYTWKVDGSAGQGFIAHELQEVVPDCVTGEKDAVETYIDEDGNEQTKPKYQGVDTSFLVATLTAAIQELKAEVDSLKAQLNNTN